MTVLTTIFLFVVAALTVPLWLSLALMPLSVILKDDTYYATTPVATAIVSVFGIFVLGLPWYAALIAGLMVGLTSYPRRTY